MLCEPTMIYLEELRHRQRKRAISREIYHTQEENIECSNKLINQ